MANSKTSRTPWGSKNLCSELWRYIEISYIMLLVSSVSMRSEQYSNSLYIYYFSNCEHLVKFFGSNIFWTVAPNSKSSKKTSITSHFIAMLNEWTVSTCLIEEMQNIFLLTEMDIQLLSISSNEGEEWGKGWTLYITSCRDFNPTFQGCRLTFFEPFDIS